MAQFTNQATLSYNNTVVNSNVATGEILEVLSATKTAVIADYALDDNVTYVIEDLNLGDNTVSKYKYTLNFNPNMWIPVNVETIE